MKLDTNTLLLAVLAVLLPPVAVYLQKDFGKELMIGFVLTMLGWLPGVVYALWLQFKR